ncbi:MAG: hypothetical protein JSU66_12240 [Deltaproteobacteria bacterium]|nr:MAG: hypothetical protein JSU66_12240 [Deltaproteobacteria bacterium]
MSARALAPLALALVVTACAAKRPVLYPNDVLVETGPELAELDIDACLELAAAYGHEAKPAEDVAKETAKGSAVGAAVGGAAGAVTSGSGPRAAAGAAGGAVLGFFRGLFRSRDPDPIQRSFVEQCLRERGYQPIGWR